MEKVLEINSVDILLQKEKLLIVTKHSFVTMCSKCRLLQRYIKAVRVGLRDVAAITYMILLYSVISPIL